MTVAPAPRRRGRALAVLAAAALALGLPAVASTASRAAGSGGVTVAAPGGGPSAKVTVSRVDGLVNQTVEVRWTGFKPSSSSQLQNSGGSYDTNTLNPVRVYQCRSDGPGGPASSASCYGSGGFAGVPSDGDGTPAIDPVPGYTYAGQTDPYASTPDGPSNTEDTVTAANGTGSVTIQIFTRQESASLGCDESHACDLVVVPNYGRPQGATEDQIDAPWAWANRTVIPLHFAQLSNNCPLGRTPLNVEGSPMSSRALLSWRGAACNNGSHAVTLNYTAIGEQQTREDFASGLSDVGLTTRPLDPGSATKFVYAPVALSGVAIAFQIDDANGVPVHSMRLDQRLVAKLITASYRVADDPNVVGNPGNLFNDPEFRALNPGVQWPSGSPGNHPILLADLSDLTWTLTSWINADPQARAFLNGKPDEYGMHVNKAYRKLALPVSSFPLLDRHQASAFQPIQGLDQVSRQLSLAQFPGALSDVENGVTVISKPARQNPGRREVIGIIDSADASAFLLDNAALRNAGGAYVKPTVGSLTTTEAHMKVSADGVTRQVNLADKAKATYPLTMVTNAVLPLGAKGARATGLRNFLAFASGRGQVQGTAAGELPPGYVPLPKSLIALDSAAAKALVHGVPAVKPAATPTSSATSPTPTDTATAPADDFSDDGDIGDTGDALAPDDGGDLAPPADTTPSPADATPTATTVVSPTATASPSASSTTTPAPVAAAPTADPAVRLVAVNKPASADVSLPLLVLLGFFALVAGGAVRFLTSGRSPWRR